MYIHCTSNRHRHVIHILRLSLANLCSTFCILSPFSLWSTCAPHCPPPALCSWRAAARAWWGRGGGSRDSDYHILQKQILYQFYFATFQRTSFSDSDWDRRVDWGAVECSHRWTLIRVLGNDNCLNCLGENDEWQPFGYHVGSVLWAESHDTKADNVGDASVASNIEYSCSRVSGYNV